MSNQRKNHQQKNKKSEGWIPKSPFHIILTLLFLLAEVSFVTLLIVVDILPTIFNIIILVIFIVFTVLIFKLLSCLKEKTVQRKVGTVISIVMILLLALGSFYLFRTYAAFNKVSDEDKQYEEFYAVALKGGSYKNADDLNGAVVFTHKGNSAAYEKAQDKLKEETGAICREAEGYLELKNVLIDAENNRHDEVIFLSSSHYEMVCEYADGFAKSTKIIYKVSVNVGNKDIAKRVGITQEPFNVYISGIDTFGGIGKVSRSDVNMIITVNPEKKEILLTSIPRDMYVKLHTYGALDKLTHSGIYGIDETVSTVEDWLDIDINYYIRVNFTTLVDVVDVLGGVDVNSDYAFKSAVSKYTYTEGINHLDGKAALFFARERKSFEEGDQQRIQNQQKVLEAILRKVTGSSVILMKYTSLLDAVDDEIQTNLSDSDISSLVKMQLEDLGGWTITKQYIKGAGTHASTYSMGSRQLYVAIPDEASLAEAQSAISEVLGE